MSVKKIDLIKIAEEALQTAFPRVSFGPPGERPPLSMKKMKSNLFNPDTLALATVGATSTLGGYTDYNKSFGVKPDTLKIPSANVGKPADLSNAQMPVFELAYGGKTDLDFFPYNLITSKLPPNSPFRAMNRNARIVGQRANLYNTIKKDIMSKQNTDPTRQAYEQELENMRRHGFSNRSSGFKLIVGKGGQPAAIPHKNEESIKDLGEFGKTIARLSPAMLMPSDFKTFGEAVAKDAPVLSAADPNSMMLHELEHTNQKENHITNDSDQFKAEIPAVASEIAHVSEAYRAATGKYPEGKYLGIPYGQLAQLAIKNNHIYGNQPMTSVLNRPESQQFIKDYMTTIRNNEMLDSYIKRTPNFYDNAARAGSTVFRSTFPSLTEGLRSAREMYSDYLKANPPQGTYMPNFNPNYGALQSESGGFQKAPKPKPEPVKQELKNPKFEKVNGRTSEEIERMLRDKFGL